jgi:hypothetical protein
LDAHARIIEEIVHNAEVELDVGAVVD